MGAKLDEVWVTRGPGPCTQHLCGGTEPSSPAVSALTPAGQCQDLTQLEDTWQGQMSGELGIWSVETHPPPRSGLEVLWVNTGQDQSHIDPSPTACVFALEEVGRALRANAKVTFTPLPLSSGTCRSSPSLQVYRQSITFLSASFPERTVRPARFPRKNWAMCSSPP